ncbi:MAG: hypothetical protein HC822_02060 [Oscillochloris sp.]|nr:hypothetical protein [Oscillochloris sp.]
MSHAACRDAQFYAAEAAAAEADPLAQLRAIVHVQYRRGAESAALLARRNPEESAVEPDLYVSLHAMLGAAISTGQANGQIRPADPAVLAAICLALLDPHTIRNLAQLSGGCADQAAEHVLAVLLDGLMVSPAHCND